MDLGVIESIKLSGTKVDQEVFVNCKYLFYDVKDSNGGYKIELSHEEKVQYGLCGIEYFIEKGKDKVETITGGGSNSD